jgi:peptide/nickel transport system permease protein
MTGLALIMRRLALLLSTLVVVSVLIYAATLVVPSDPARQYLGRFATAEEIAEFNAENGLDRPITVRYAEWAGDFVVGDWGRSLSADLPVREVMAPRLVNSAVLGLMSFALTLALAGWLGLVAGKRPGSPVDAILSLAVLTLVATPEFVIGILLLTVLAVQLGLLPITSDAAGEGVFTEPSALVLPLLTMVLVFTPALARYVRVAVREASMTPHVRAAALRGLGARRITWGHLMPTAAAPIVNMVGLTLAAMLSGALVIETVFAFPGVGLLVIDAVGTNDVAVVQAGTVILGTVLIVLNFAADAVVALLTPRRRLLEGG